MARDPQTLTPKQAQAAVLIGSGRTRAVAARDAGVNEATVYTWLQDPVFKQAVDEAQAIWLSEIQSTVIGALHARVNDCLAMEDPAKALGALAKGIEGLAKHRQVSELCQASQARVAVLRAESELRRALLALQIAQAQAGQAALPAVIEVPAPIPESDWPGPRDSI